MTAVVDRAPGAVVAPGPGLVPGFALAAAAALALALRLPAQTTVLGLIAFGLLHNVLELRYVLGRFATLLAGPYLVLLLTLAGGIALVRAAQLGAPGQRIEIVLGYAVLAAGLARTRRTPLILAGAAVLAASLTASLTWPAYHFVVLTHVHNLVPLAFLWEWSRDLRRRPTRWAFRAVQLGWVAVVPGLLLAGVLDAWAAHPPTTTGVGFAGTLASITAPCTPAAWASGPAALRFLTAFAFLQTMHYVVWCLFVPRWGRSATAAFEARASEPGWSWVRAVTGRRPVLIGAAAGVLVGATLIADWRSGRTLYGSLAVVHVYLEFPVVLALLAALAVPRTPPPAPTSTRSRP